MQNRNVEVVNLKTGQTLVYSGLTPKEAVTAAYCYGKEDFNTWNYHKLTVPLEYGEKTICCGDWCVRI